MEIAFALKDPGEAPSVAPPVNVEGAGACHMYKMFSVDHLMHTFLGAGALDRFSMFSFSDVPMSLALFL